MNIKFFDNTLENFIASLEKLTIAKVLRTIDLLEKFGHLLGMPHSKKIGRCLFELRIRGIQKIRIFYTFYDKKIVLLHGFIKKTNHIPTRELQTAKQKLKTFDNI